MSRTITQKLLKWYRSRKKNHFCGDIYAFFTRLNRIVAKKRGFGVKSPHIVKNHSIFLGFFGKLIWKLPKVHTFHTIKFRNSLLKKFPSNLVIHNKMSVNLINIKKMFQKFKKKLMEFQSWGGIRVSGSPKDLLTMPLPLGFSSFF